tara:strand:+ start:184 stop:543 length:360 start_codon:yes stop_codon:yes gene_type:complete
MLGVAAGDQVKTFIIQVCEAMALSPLNDTGSALKGVFHMRMTGDQKAVTVWSPKYMTQRKDGTIKHTFQLTTARMGDGWVENAKERFRYRLTHQYLPKEEADKIKALQKEARTRKRKRV